MSQKHGDSFVEIFLKYSDEGVELLASKHGREAIDVIAKLGENGEYADLLKMQELITVIRG